jgi:hypothetical protein
MRASSPPAPAAVARPGARGAVDRYGLLAVLALAVLPYLNALNAFWVGDDYNYVVPKTLATVINFFNPVGRAAYRPTNWLTWAVDYQLFGPNPPGWHLTGLLLHAVCTLLVVLLTRELVAAWRPGDGGAGRWLPLLTGAFFAVHPSHPETVTWTGGRADLPFALGLFLAAWAFARWRRGGGARWYALAAVGVWLAILGKEAGLIAPLALLLIDLTLPARPGAATGAAPRGGGRALALALAEPAARVALFLAAMAALLVVFGNGAGALMPLLLLAAGWPLARRAQAGGAASGWGRLAALVRVETPFWVMAGGYAALRVGLSLVGLGRLMYGAETQFNVGPGTLLDAVAGYILIAVGAWEAPATVATWALAARLGLIAAALLVVGLAVWRLGRPALFAALWMPATALVTYEASANRWFYAASFGLCLLAALACHALARRGRAWGLAPAALLIAAWAALTLTVNTRWVESGEVARGIVAQIRAVAPDPPRPATFYMANPPYSYRGVLLFNSGFALAPAYAYQDYTGITGYELQEHAAQAQAALANPALVGPNPVFLRYEAGRLIRYPSLAALVAAGR